ncbi:Defensin-like protein 5 [Striga hermonthica]|uniref:Defensin-like protein 5 n=1 Tax=Striga hermonthica TaxID=68872 RepID=A0A9N7MT30_STRHE|nr:Defensin-like protein 5 [Striga hermonthica]
MHGFHFADDKIAMHVEAVLCEMPSTLFHGVCAVGSNCARICKKEGYLTGKCKGVLPKCICLQDCGGKPPEVPPPEGPPEVPPPESPPPEVSHLRDHLKFPAPKFPHLKFPHPKDLQNLRVRLTHRSPQ